MPVINKKGLEALHAYHEAFFSDFAAFSNVQIEMLQQVAEDAHVVIYLKASGEHSRTFFGIVPTGKQGIELNSIPELTENSEGARSANHRRGNLAP